ncbi:MAG: hypothetical protein FWC26_11845 [Fibromonadales bacterium]|nr:hypothetical protein [Fibromonadales bacterium]
MNSRFFAIFFLMGMAFAQELPNAVLPVNGAVPQGFYKAGIRYGEAQGDSLYIRWSRAADADTFWVYKAGSSLQYITNSNTRTVWYSQPLAYERRMAVHHLKEYIFDSPIRFNDLESLSKNRNPILSGKSFHEYFMR